MAFEFQYLLSTTSVQPATMHKIRILVHYFSVYAHSLLRGIMVYKSACDGANASRYRYAVRP